MKARYLVELTDVERNELRELVSGGKARVRKVKRAQILLAADRGETDAAIASSVAVGTSTVYRTKRRLVEHGLEQALSEGPRAGASRKLTGREEVLLVAIACSTPPEGRGRWTLELLAGEMVRRTEHGEVSRETVRRRLAEQQLKPWQKKMWCIPAVDTEYVARMEDVLDLYTQAPDPLHPVVCFDETPVQLIGETRVAWPVEPGKPTRIDYEYRRNGTANLFVFLDAHQPWRHVKVTERKTALDFAQSMHDLVHVHYPQAHKLRVVLDNFSAHKPAALYEAFPAELARELLRRLEFHFVPKHASWLNMVEIEIGVLVRQCLDRRIPDWETLTSEVAHWERRRNNEGARVKWLFDVNRAREKLGRVYPTPMLTELSQAA
jgi:transposase